MGTKAYENERLRKREAARQRAVAEAAALTAKRDNQAAARAKLENLVKLAAGWQTLDSWATETLDKLTRGETIDLIDLDSKIAAWLAANAPSDAPASDQSDAPASAEEGSAAI